MSELDTPETNPAASPKAGSLTEAVIVAHLKTCQSILVRHAGERFDIFVKELNEQLLEYSDRAGNNQEQAGILEQQKLLRQRCAELERYFLGYLGEGFIKFKRKELSTNTGEEKYQGDILSLVDNEDLEETIAISSITHRAENHYAETLWSLNQRFAVLNGGLKVDDRANPAGPVQYCESLRKAFKRAALTTKTKIIAYKIFDRQVVSQLADTLSEVSDYLSNQGILPNLQYRPVSHEAPPVAQVEEVPYEDWGAAQGGSVEAGHPGEVVLPGVMGCATAVPGYMPSPDSALPTEQYQGRLVEAIRTLQGHINSFSGGDPVPTGPTMGSPAGHSPHSPGAYPQTEAYAPAGVPAGGAAVPGGRPVMVYTNQQLVGALQSLQTEAMSVTGAQIMAAQPGQLQVQGVAAVSGQLTSQLVAEAEEDGQAVDSSDMHTIDLVGMLFEYMLSDDNLPDSIKALLSYLHTPFLKVAFIDKDFFEQTEHPARLLLNSMAEAGVKWVGNDGSSQYDIYDKIKGMVSRVLEEFKNDVRLFAELLLGFSGYTKKISRRQELMERRAMEKVQGEETLREVKIRVNNEVRTRTDGRELPSAVLLMLLQPWSDYMAFILLRYGEQSDTWQRVIQVIDDILWSIEPKQKNADKTRQLEMHDSLLDVLEAGFETIGYDQTKGKKLLEALFSLQKMALQSKKVEPAPAPMRDKLESMAAEKAGHASEVDEEPTEEEARMVENLKMIEFGTWFEFEGGKRLKVAWYNSRTLHYMLVDQMGKKVAMKSGLELARAMLAHKAKVIAGSSKPFFERALENIFHSLNSKAEGAEVTARDE